MHIITHPSSWIRPDGSVGLVPTMGALHQGHRSLIERSLEENEHTVLSIFSNPTQFDDKNDFAAYPKTLEADKRMARGVDTLFVPEDLYPDDYRYRVSERLLSQEMEGASRPGHFDGMLTVVLKLLIIFSPTRAYFGEKDYQQLRLVQGMQEAFYLPTQIVACPTVREPSGLALSSRNRRLSPEGQKRAQRFAKALFEGKDLRAEGFAVDYQQEWENRRCAAVQIDGVRLIDNVEITCG